ncbi:iron chelate uptake ABC transporter family permease subunit [Allonocardiopsis opalescens]|uniref:iron chelate uptake ABC transporter family permease subunit n=1 Tax=Allonocardiopsis opalescens TaxID=1144618 RepID=UPI001473464A|nr:iron chelate uptake ABC transporter family permease subunit [Allonocardiopsis opalescens]
MAVVWVRSVVWRSLVVVAAVGSVPAVAWAALTVGAFPLGFGEAVEVLRGGGRPQVRLIVWELRLPRLLVAVAVGAGLAVAGVLVQGVAGVRLVDGRGLGAASGAALACVVAAGAGAAVSVPWVLMAAGVVGAGAVAAVWWWLGSRVRGVLGVVGLGLGVDAVLSVGAAVLAAVWFGGEAVRHWALGSLAGLDLGWAWAVWLVVPVPAVAGVVVAWSGGEGPRLRGGWSGAGVVLAALLVGVCVSAVGPVALVGVGAGLLAAWAVGGHWGWAALAAAPLGASLLLAVDLVARTLVAPVEIPAGLLALPVALLVMAVGVVVLVGRAGVDGVVERAGVAPGGRV